MRPTRDGTEKRGQVKCKTKLRIVSKERKDRRTVLRAAFRRSRRASFARVFFISEMPQMETVFQKEGAHEKGGCFARRHATQPPRTGASRSTRIRNEVIAEGPSGSHVPCVFVGRRRLRAGAPSSTLLPPASDLKRGTFPHTGGAGASSLRPVGENNAKLRRSELPTDTPSPAPVLRRPP